LIAHLVFPGAPKAQIEDLFGRLDIVAPALLAVGLLILLSSLKDRSEAPEQRPSFAGSTPLFGDNVTFSQAGWMGAVQGLCLPFRGFSRSGATISTGLLTNTTRQRAERFSFALAVILTPIVVLRELQRLQHATADAALAGTTLDLHGSIVAALLGLVVSFIAGLAALRWLSSWLEHGRWWLFGVYCIVASGVVFYLHHLGY
jgi:undecaprenyl-diphosphatase